MPQINWDVLKDWVEISGVVLGGVWFGMRMFGMIKADKAIFEERFDSIDQKLSELNDKKQDKEMSDLYFRNSNEAYQRMTAEIGNVKKDVSERLSEMQDTVAKSNKQVSDSLNSLAGQVGQLTGGIEVIKDIVLKSYK